MEPGGGLPTPDLEGGGKPGPVAVAVAVTGAGGGKVSASFSDTTVEADSDGGVTASERVPPVFVPKETVMQALNTIIQVHFEKTLEKKRSVDGQKKELWKLFQFFFVFLAILFAGVVQSVRLRCRDCWMPIVLCLLGHVIFYAAMAQTLRCINAFKYQRRCHKLTIGLATEKLNRLKRIVGGTTVPEEEYEVRYQEPAEAYFNKFKRNWALFFLFLVITFCFMLASMATLLCSQ